MRLLSVVVAYLAAPVVVDAGLTSGLEMVTKFLSSLTEKSLTNTLEDSGTCTNNEQSFGAVSSESSYEIECPAEQAPDEHTGADMGEPQVAGMFDGKAVLERIKAARTYLRQQVYLDPKYEKVRELCVNKHASCAFWAVKGECENNPGYMNVNCAPVCQTCEQLDIETRCPLDPDAVDALQPGDLNKMFERIINDPFYQQYQPVVLSRPSYATGDTAENATYNIGIWMVMFENALSGAEADRMIELGGIKGYERSKDVGVRQLDGSYSAEVNGGRTSTNAWCIDSCYKDPVAQRLMDRIANITGIPETNSENLQLLRYEKSQFYQTHNDYIPYQLERPCGVRILTFYMYLNDVEEGGGTDFPKLGMTVKPRRGRAVMWPSVYDDKPNEKDPRSDHQAMPVIEGVKYGANAWIHMRDFKTPNSKGC